MKKISIIIICVFLLLSAVNFGASDPIEINNETSEMDLSIDNSPFNEVEKQQILHNIAQFDGYFTENHGQVGNDAVRYYIQGKGVWFTDDGVWYELREYDEPRGRGSGTRSQGGVRDQEPQTPTLTHSQTHTPTNSQTHTQKYQRVILKQEFIGANQIQPVGNERLSWNSNYFYGNDSSKWCTEVPNYQEIIYENLYENIDLRYYSSNNGLKYDFIVHPGGEPNDIRLTYNGAQGLDIDNSGNLEIKTQVGDIVDSDLLIYQDQKNNKNVVKGNFKILTSNTYGFDIIDGYNGDETLIIDPLIYSTYIGGSGEDRFGGFSIDNTGNSYLTGHTNSSDFPNTTGAYDTTFSGFFYDAFVLKLNPNGSTLVYSTYIGGSGGYGDYGGGIYCDNDGNAYLTGDTNSSDFPTTNGAYDTSHNGGRYDAFVLKLNKTGSALLFSTFIGGSGADGGADIEIDLIGNVYVTGGTTSSDFPTTSGAYDRTFNSGSIGGDVVIFKFNSDGSDLLFSTYVGGNSYDNTRTIEIDQVGNSYVSGFTRSSDFPTTANAYDNTYNGGVGYADCFVL